MRAIKLFFTVLLSTTVLCGAIYAPVAAADSSDTSNFYFNSFNADYYLSKNNSGHATMNVVENLDAVFPEYDQNKGIVRYIPKDYDGHTLNFKLISLTRNGVTEPIYKTYSSNGFEVVETGNNDYIRGEQYFTIKYELTDVVKSFGNTQELYWDTNGTGWGQKFNSVTATVHVDSQIANGLTSNVSCYQGAYGSKEKCDSTVDKSSKEITFKSTRILNKNENMTLDVQFSGRIFNNYEYTLIDYVEIALKFLALLIGLACFTTCVFMIIKYAKNAKGRGIIIPQYTERNGMPIFLSSEIYSVPIQKTFTSEIVKLAVNKKIKIVENDEKNVLFSQKKYSLVLCDTSNIDRYDSKVIKELFPDEAIGSIYNFKRNDNELFSHISKIYADSREESVKLNYRVKNSTAYALFYVFLIIGCISITVSLSAMTGNSSGIIPIVFMFIFLLITIFYCVGSGGRSISVNFRPLTNDGRVEYDYLAGLKLYINMAEKDRLEYLQSPNGATKVDLGNKQQLVYLYEKLLPYAVLFNLEKQWSKQISIYYEEINSVPAWYVGSTMFNAAEFSSSLNSFSNFVSNSSMSSPSSGAGGGGFSGGGGGGGGGGGR